MFAHIIEVKKKKSALTLIDWINMNRIVSNKIRK